jgi:ABC-type transport system involved in cytochrome c biogenesis permease component
MFSSTMALFTRSFRVDARSTLPHVLRLLFACAILLELIWTHEMELMFGAPGLTVFMWISWLNFAVISLAGIGYFSSAISEEKEEDSLGLLKMAGVGPVALLLGKSTTRLVSVLLLLAVEFPFVLLSITLGGVTMHQVIAMAAALAAYLIFVANLGLFCSVVAANTRRASTMVTVTLILLLAVAPILAQVCRIRIAAANPDSIAKYCFAGYIKWEDRLSMWSRVLAITSTGFDESPLSGQVLFDLAAAIAFFGLSWTGFERFTRERNSAGMLSRVFVRSTVKRPRLHVGRAWTMALTWKDFNFVAGGTRVLIGKFVLYFLVIGGLVWLITHDDRRPDYPKVLGGSAMCTMIAAAVIELGLIASRIFREEVKANTLPLLMMLPKTATEIAAGKMACALPALIPAATYFVLGAMLNADDFHSGFKGIFTSSAGWYFVTWFFIFLLVTAYASLVVKWGAFPLAVFLVFFCQMLLFTGFSAVSWTVFGAGSPREGMMFGTLLAISVPIIPVFARLIPKRLKKLAAR